MSKQSIIRQSFSPLNRDEEFRLRQSECGMCVICRTINAGVKLEDRFLILLDDVLTRVLAHSAQLPSIAPSSDVCFRPCPTAAEEAGVAVVNTTSRSTAVGGVGGEVEVEVEGGEAMAEAVAMGHPDPLAQVGCTASLHSSISWHRCGQNLT